MTLEAISQIVITKDYQKVIELLKDILPPNGLIETFIKDKDNFLVSDANEVISRAYLSSKEKIFLILYSEHFSEVVQNRLLKIIEEPPKNKEFILITPLKSTLLSTIKSRLPLISLKDNNENLNLKLNLTNLTLDDVYNFIQNNKRLKNSESILIIEYIIKNAIKSNSFILDDKTFDLFYKSRLALELGSPPDFILTTLLLKLLSKKKKGF